MIHYRLSGRYVCGTGTRWGSQTITSTTSRTAVTCRGCQRTHAYREASR